MYKTKSFFKVNLFSWISTIILISFVFLFFFIYQQTTKFERDSKLLRESYMKYKKDLLYNDTLNTVVYLRSEWPEIYKANANVKNSTLSSLKDRLRIMSGGVANTSIIDSTGKVLFSSHDESEENLQFKNQKILLTLQQKSKDPSGGFIFHQKSKTCDALMYYAMSVGNSWIVCKELKEDDIAREYAVNKKRLKIDIILESIFIGILAFIIMIVALRFSCVISRSMRREVELITDYLNSPFRGGKLDANDFSYKELKFIASSSVEMVEEIKELLEKLKTLAVDSKAILMDDVSHEIRNKLNVIKGASDFIHDENFNLEQKKRMLVISNSAQSIAKLLNNITLLSENEYFIHEHKSSFNISHIYEEIHIRFFKELKDKSIEFRLKMHDDVPALLTGNRFFLKQIIINLVENAIQFTKNGLISLNVVKNSQKGNDFQLDFVVTDTGLGISEKKLKIIEDIAHYEILNSPKFTAAALNLSVCRKLISSLGGKLFIESEKGSGSSFTALIPVTAAEEKDVDPYERKHNDVGKGLKALIVEDNPENARIEELYLKKMGFNVDCAVNGLEGIAKIKDKNYDIVFMDYEMPELNGVETTKKIREMERESGEHLKIFALTAYSREKEMKKAIEAGMDDYILKPFDMESVTEILKRHI